jgi:hypothetical protein
MKLKIRLNINGRATKNGISLPKAIRNTLPNEIKIRI